ncbi:hypothetical protein P7C73_g4033, partial [Tremellales sp. Uapishka_1]
MAGSSTGFDTSDTYQTVIIAIVAAGIVLTTIATLVYRRHRRRRQLIEGAGLMRMRLILTEDGRIIHIPIVRPSSAEEKDVGKEPILWESVLENESGRVMDEWDLQPIAVTLQGESVEAAVLLQMPSEGGQGELPLLEMGTTALWAGSGAVDELREKYGETEKEKEKKEMETEKIERGTDTGGLRRERVDGFRTTHRW